MEIKSIKINKKGFRFLGSDYLSFVSTLIVVCLFSFLILNIPVVSAVSTGTGINPDITTEDFGPLVWMCDNRVVYDDATEPGRISEDGEVLVERFNNYAFEGEQLAWDILVMDKNGVEKISDVFVTLGTDQNGADNTNIPIIITEQHQLSYCDKAGPLSGRWQDNLTLPMFDSSLGTLTDVVFNFSNYFIANFSFEHTSMQGSADYIATLNGSMIIDPPEGGTLISKINFYDSGNLAPFDGVVDFQGPSGKSIIGISNSDYSEVTSDSIVDYITTTGENIMIPVTADSIHTVEGPGDFDTSLKTSSEAEGCVTYTYETRTVIGGGGSGNDIEANCQYIINPEETEFESCNARILEEQLVWNPEVMQFYRCIFTVETPESMYGEYWINVVAEDLDGLYGAIDEPEFWFLNPVISISFDGDLRFEDVRAGTSSYSETILVGNDADEGSGVLLDMFITGTDFYDSSTSGAMCPTTNQLALSSFRYYVSNGAYNSRQDANNDLVDGDRDTDSEGYTNIEYGIGFNNPTPFYDNAEILQAGPMTGPYYMANILAPGAEMTITFKLDLPEPCNGDFDSGSIYFWGEAI